MRKTALCLLVLFALAACKEETAPDDNDTKTVPTDGLVAYYNFDDGTADLSGNNYHGSLVNNPDVVSGRHGDDKAYEFDGIDDYINTSSDISLVLGTGTSFSTWIKLDNSSSTGSIIANYNGLGTGGDCEERRGFRLTVSPEGAVRMLYVTDGDDYDGRDTENGLLTAGTWHHIIGTWAGEYKPSSFKLYVDGQQKDFTNFEIGDCDCGYVPSTLKMQIGATFCKPGLCLPFEGSIDDVRIYDRVLNATEIQQLFEE